MNTNKFKHTNKQHEKQTLLNPNGAIEARVGGRETKMVRAVGTDAFTESEEHWHGVPFEVLPLRTELLLKMRFEAVLVGSY